MNQGPVVSFGDCCVNINIIMSLMRFVRFTGTYLGTLIRMTQEIVLTKLDKRRFNRCTQQIH